LAVFVASTKKIKSDISKFGVAFCGMAVFVDLGSTMDNPVEISALFTSKGALNFKFHKKRRGCLGQKIPCLLELCKWSSIIVVTVFSHFFSTLTQMELL